MMRKIEPSAFGRMPWKNGGGETTEIAVSPAGASVSDFDWRVSTANVASPGPFSMFQGIDRSLVVLSGRGLRLVTSPPGGVEVVVLDPTSAPFLFAGDVPTRADLIDGDAVVDFNVMTRRNTFKHVLRRVKTREVTVIEGCAIVLFCVAGSANCCGDGNPVVITVGDALVVEGTRAGDIRAISVEPRGDDACEFLAAQFFAQE